MGVGQQRQAALLAEKEMLLAKLEEQSKQQSKREREAREKMEKDVEGTEERDEMMNRFELKIKSDEENEEKGKKKLIEDMERKVKHEEEKRLKEIQERDSVGVGESREELTKVISQRRKMAEFRMMQEKLVLENAVKVGQQRQAALLAEKEMLLARLEEQSKQQSKREREAREKM